LFRLGHELQPLNGVNCLSCASFEQDLYLLRVCSCLVLVCFNQQIQPYLSSN
jgi:hypothetical protein